MRNSSLILIFLTFGLPLFFCSCTVTRLIFPYDNDLVENPSFVNPEMTFRTFSAGVRNDNPEIEFYSLSEPFKERYEISLGTYHLIRPRILEKEPYITWVGRMAIDEVKQNNDKEAFVAVSLFSKKLIVRMIRQDYGFVMLKDGSKQDFFLPGSVADAIRGDETSWRIFVESPFLRGIDKSQIISFQLLPEWKILSFEQPTNP